MLIKRAADICSSEIIDKRLYHGRREFLRAAAGTVALAAAGLGLFAFFYGTLHLLTYVIADRFAGLDFQNGVVGEG